MKTAGSIKNAVRPWPPFLPDFVRGYCGREFRIPTITTVYCLGFPHPKLPVPYNRAGHARPN
jgi:hypothetical protein